jgi:hypothetical protein
LNDINQLGSENQYRKQVWHPINYLDNLNGHNISFLFLFF